MFDVALKQRHDHELTVVAAAQLPCAVPVARTSYHGIRNTAHFAAHAVIADVIQSCGLLLTILFIALTLQHTPLSLRVRYIVSP